MQVSFLGEREVKIKRFASKLRLTPRQFIMQAVDSHMASLEEEKRGKIQGNRPHGRDNLGRLFRPSE